MIAPLEGVKVLESAQLLNGDTVGMFLGDMGADVIKVEAPPLGDYLRYFLGQLEPGWSVPHLQVNKNKRSVALDLKTDAGREAFLRLAATSDIVVDGNRPGALDRLGVGYKQLRLVNPRLVFVRYTAYGSIGPYRDIPTHGMMMGALAGAHLVREGDDGFLHGYRSDVDGTEMAGEATVVGATQAAMWACAALVRARESGHGCFIDVSAADAVVVEAYLPTLFQLNGPRITDRSGMVERSHGEMTGARYQFYATRDDRVLLFCCIEPKFWRNFCAAIDRPDLLGSDVAADGNAQVTFGGDELRRELTQIIKERDLAQWVELAAAFDIAMGPANQGVLEMAADPGLAERGLIFEDAHPQAGTYAVVGASVLIDGERYALRRHAPGPGQHTAEVLQERGFTAEEVAGLMGNQVTEVRV